MRQEIAYALIALMVIAAAILALVVVRRGRHRKTGNLRVDLLKKDEQ